MIASSKDVAIEIRKLLKKEFPSIKFSVTSFHNKVQVDYTDGTNQINVENLLSKFEYGSFDGMEDIYNYDNVLDGLPQCKYVFVNRTISAQKNAEILEKIKSEYGNIMDQSEREFFKTFQCWKNNFVYRYINNNNL